MPIPFAQSSFPEIYERALVQPLFRPWAELLLQDAELSGGERLLDVACGTGIVARLAKERIGNRGKVVGVDVNPPMVAMARSVAPGIDWREGDAASLPLREDESFDVLVCQQGLQFVADKPAAAREMRRALGPAGRVAVSTWQSDEGMPVLRELRRIAEGHLGPVQDRRHSFGDPEAIEALLREAGFDDVQSKTVSRTIRFEDGTLFVRLNALALLGMSEAGPKLGEAERGQVLDAITRDSAGVVRDHTDAQGFSYVIDATVVTAQV